MSAVLRTGPMGLESVLTATSAAATNPMPAPAAVGQYCCGAIQPRQTAIRAASGADSSPPTTPPAHKPRVPNALPTMEPSAPPSPPSTQLTTNSNTRGMRSILGEGYVVPNARRVPATTTPGGAFG